MTNQISQLLILLLVSNGRLVFGQNSLGGLQREGPFDELLEFGEELLPLAVNLTKVPLELLGIEKLRQDLEIPPEDLEYSPPIDPRLFVFRRNGAPGPNSRFNRVVEEAEPPILDNQDSQMPSSYQRTIQQSHVRRIPMTQPRSLTYNGNDIENPEPSMVDPIPSAFRSNSARRNSAVPDIDPRLFVFRRNNGPPNSRMGSNRSRRPSRGRQSEDNTVPSKNLLRQMLLNMLQNPDS